MSNRTGTWADLKKIFPIKLNDNDKKNEDVISLCVAKAYNDAKRTFKGIKEEQRNEIKRELQNYFKCEKNWKDQKSFDDWHKKICDKLCDLRYGTETVKYGQAQKIVNMTFKYLYCSDEFMKSKGFDENKYDEFFKFCHMPLDSYTLKGWFENEVLNWYNKQPEQKNGKIYKKDIPDWSTMNKYETEIGSYLWIQCRIRDYLKNDNNKKYCDKKGKLTPFKAEFYIWAEQQWKYAVNEIQKQRICDEQYPKYYDKDLCEDCDELIEKVTKTREKFKKSDTDA